MKSLMVFTLTIFYVNCLFFNPIQAQIDNKDKIKASVSNDIKKLNNDEIRAIGMSYKDFQNSTGKLQKLVGVPDNTKSELLGMGITFYKDGKYSTEINKYLMDNIFMKTMGDFASDASFGNPKLVARYKEERSMLDSVGVIKTLEDLENHKKILDKIIADTQAKNNITIERPEEVYKIYKKKFKQ